MPPKYCSDCEELKRAAVGHLVAALRLLLEGHAAPEVVDHVLDALRALETPAGPDWGGQDLDLDFGA